LDRSFEHISSAVDDRESLSPNRMYLLDIVVNLCELLNNFATPVFLSGLNRPILAYCLYARLSGCSPRDIHIASKMVVSGSCLSIAYFTFEPF
jgi:hypothetical protein